MNAGVRKAYRREMAAARSNWRAGDIDAAFRALERAHILGQRYFLPHLETHAWMLRVGVKRMDGREIRGQLLRLAAVVPGFLSGWVPKGNTGGADVSPLRPMEIPADVEPVLAHYRVERDVQIRLALWIGFGAVAAAVLA